jgi:hypothetical protein
MLVPIVRHCYPSTLPKPFKLVKMVWILGGLIYHQRYFQWGQKDAGQPSRLLRWLLLDDTWLDKR